MILHLYIFDFNISSYMQILFTGEDENLVYVKFFKCYRCYDLIPVSAKLVVFDTQLLVSYHYLLFIV